MITLEQRQKLKAIADYSGTDVFMAGAEALARIQSETSESAKKERGLTPEEIKRADEFMNKNADLMDDLVSSGSDEEAAKEYSDKYMNGDVDCRPGFGRGPYARAFLYGCARYRPIVEEMLADLKRLVNRYYKPGNPYEDIIARAEALLKEAL